MSTHKTAEPSWGEANKAMTGPFLAQLQNYDKGERNSNLI